MLSLDRRGDLQVAWAFTWPTAGSAGPSHFDGVVEGGTGAYAEARGTFHAVALPDHDLVVTATVTS